MDHSVFIVLAYAIAGALIALLCLTSWLRARSINRQIDNLTKP